MSEKENPKSRVLAPRKTSQSMAETSSPMEIDLAVAQFAPAPEKVNKGVSGGKSAPWVEKYRPQSLADVAAHRDIVDTSTCALLLF